MSHYTIEDKDRPVDLVPDGEWHPFTIKDVDGSVRVNIKPKPGIYILLPSLLGRLLIPTLSELEVRIERYPFDPDDHGTAWTSIPTDRGVTTTWMGSWAGKVIVNESGEFSTSIGLSYRYRGGKLECSQRLLKFVHQRDD